ncbi:MAG: hypothetical protein ACJ76N_06690 [Thermoanaerobaculia bacterium]
MTSARPRWRWWGALLLVIAPIALLLAAVARLGVNTLLADEFYYVDFIKLVREGGDWTPWIWLQHNEHRVIPMKLLMVLLAGPTRWSQHAEMLCSVGLSALIVLVLWRVYRSRVGGSDAAGLLAFAPVAWLVCSLSQYENQFFGMMVCHYFTALGAVASLWLLARGGWISTLLAVLAAVMGAFSIVNGFLVFPAGIAVLAAHRAGWGRWTAWCLGGGAAITLYFRSYLSPPHTPVFQRTLVGAYKILKLWLATAGAPLAAGSVAWGITLGALLMAVSVFLGLRWLQADPARREKDSVAVGLLLFGLASAAMVAAGRAFMNPPNDPLGSRYITYSTLAWIGAYFLVLGRAGEDRQGAWKTVAWSLLVPGLLAANLHGLAEARRWRDQRLLDQYVFQTITLQSDAVVPRLGPPSSVRPAASYLSAARLSAFAEPQRIVMLMNATNAKPTGEILRGQEVEQRLVCPVGKLYDAAVMILPSALPDGDFVVTVASGGRELARRSFTTASLREWTWVQVLLDTPLPCAGRDLTVRIESLNTTPGSGVMVLANEPYYQGELRQGGAPIPDRRLGMALNAFHFGILP